MIKKVLMNKKREQKDFKKGQGNQEDNYRSESNLANISKLFGRSLLQQLSSYFDNIRWMHQFGFRKDFNQQLCLAAVIESRKANTVLGKSFWASPKDFQRYLIVFSTNIWSQNWNYMGSASVPLS